MILNDNKFIGFSIPEVKGTNAPIIDLDGLTALVDGGASDVILSVSTEDVITAGGKFEQRYADVAGVNGIDRTKPAGEIYTYPLIIIGQKQYENIPVIVKDIDISGIDAIIGRSIFGPGAFHIYNNNEHTVEFYFPKLVFNKKCFWFCEKETGAWRELTPVTINHSYAMAENGRL